MKKNAKLIVATCLAFVGAGVWVPTLVPEPEGAPPDAPSDVPADVPADALGTDLADEGEEDGPGVGAGGPEGEPRSGLLDLAGSPGGAHSAEPGARLERLQGALRLVESLVPERPPEDLAGLLGGAAPAQAERTASPVASASARALLVVFSEENQLTGVLTGGGRALAMLGHRVVAPGERLAEGRIRVAEVTPTSLRLVAGDEELVLELPPFRAVRRPASAGGAAGGVDGTEGDLGERPEERVEPAEREEVGP